MHSANIRLAGPGRLQTDDLTRPEEVDIAPLVRACEERLNPRDEWKPFEGYSQSLAISVLDAIWSINLRYPVARGVIGRYRSARRWQGNPDEDGLPDLLAVYDRLNGVDSFIEEVGTRNRVSTKPDALQGPRHARFARAYSARQSSCLSPRHRSTQHVNGQVAVRAGGHEQSAPLTAGVHLVGGDAPPF